MAITQCIPTSAKLAFLNGDLSGSNTYKLALYYGTAVLSSSTAAYTTSNEISGSGYTAGGATLTSRIAGVSGGVAILDFADVVYTSSSFTTAGGMIYNDTRGTKDVVAILSFGSDRTVTSGSFTIQFPTADSTNAIIRIS